ncbi:MAG: hypothetical protein EOM20_11080 [Spartobacteria bacterium]|nr:hypothetical protein [Spartobacteria bacterium]
MAAENETLRSEEWFLEQMEKNPMELEPLVTWLRTLYKNGAFKQADSSAELLQDTLMDRCAEVWKDIPPSSGERETPLSARQALQVLEMRAGWNERNPAFRKKSERQADEILGASPESRALIQNAGFDGAVPLTECFKRLNVLRALKPGVLCYDKTWGGGVVKDVDIFYKRVTIDFEEKAHHQMSFNYAGETLQILDSDHLFSRTRKDPEGIKKLIEEDAAEIIRITLRSFGPMSIAQIQEALVPRVMPETAWKKFWDAARKALKKDPLVDIPAKRSEPITLLDKEKGYDDEWFKALASERGMKKLLTTIEELRKEADRATISPEHMAVVGERLAFVIKGAEGHHPGWHALAILEALEFDVDAEFVDTRKELSDLMQEAPFLAAVKELPARELKRFLARLNAMDTETTEALLLRLLPKLDISTLNEAMDLLISTGREEKCATIFRDQTTESQEAGVMLLYWLMRHDDKLQAWSLGSLPDLARWILRILNEDFMGDELKTQNQLKSRFEQSSWMKPVLEAMEESERIEFVRAVKSSMAWSTIDKRSILATMVKLQPELEAILAAKDETKGTKRTSASVTSIRSYEERQVQLARIINVEIPAVAKEIGVAREYGDLSENHEYKAAKEKQALLLRRRGELEQMLEQIRPFDFQGVDSSRAGQGTSVELQMLDGRLEVYNILGVWDRDEALNIISSDSALARAVEGHKQGESVMIPTEDGEQPCKILFVGPLPPPVKEWLKTQM